MSVRRLTRRLHRAAPPLLISLAVAAYAIGVARAHGDASRLADRVAFAQRLGSAAQADPTQHTAALRSESATGGAVIAADSGRPMRVTWRLDALAAGLRPGERIEAEEVFVAGERLRFERADGFAQLSLDGRTVATIHPRTRDFDGASGVGADAGTQMVDVPPGVRSGFRFSVAPPFGNVRRAQTLALILEGAVWTVERAGVRATVAPPPAATSSGPGAALLAGLGSIAAGALAYGALAVRRRQAAPRGAAQLEGR